MLSDIFSVCFSTAQIVTYVHTMCLLCGVCVAYLSLPPPHTVSLFSLFCQVVHPKSDSQRRRLVESVKKIFLFKSLDTVSDLSLRVQT